MSFISTFLLLSFLDDKIPNAFIISNISQAAPEVIQERKKLLCIEQRQKLFSSCLSGSVNCSALFGSFDGELRQ